jgi:hypothetical protein
MITDVSIIVEIAGLTALACLFLSESGILANFMLKRQPLV